MAQHKWHKEIEAWADGLDVEMSFDNGKSWEKFDDDWEATDGIEYRIKPQPKEPQYLYIYSTENGIEFGTVGMTIKINKLKDRFECIGKIKLEDENC